MAGIPERLECLLDGHYRLSAGGYFAAGADYGLIALFYGLQPQLKPVAACLQRVGRTALSSYLLQSVCGVILFEYLGYFCQFDRLTLLAFVPLMWLINILFSTLWLRYFSQGPVEWLWRQAANKLAAR